MLVLARHRNERIRIGDDVVVTIVEIRGDKVRLGIDAPNDVAVHRQEVYDAIKREGQKLKPADVVPIQQQTPPNTQIDHDYELPPELRQHPKTGS